MLEQRSQLPVFQYKSALVEAIRTNRVVVIKGATGCGKTTQVQKRIFKIYLVQCFVDIFSKCLFLSMCGNNTPSFCYYIIFFRFHSTFSMTTLRQGMVLSVVLQSLRLVNVKIKVMFVFLLVSQEVHSSYDGSYLCLSVSLNWKLCYPEYYIKLCSFIPKISFININRQTVVNIWKYFNCG